MNSIKIIAILLLVFGIAAASYGGFNYTHKTKEAQLGPLSLSVKQKHHVDIPLWAGAIAIVVGGVLLLAENGHNGSTRNG